MSIIKKIAAGVLGASLMLSGANAKTLKIAYDADPVTLDIQEQLSGATLQHSHLVFDALIRWTKDHSFEGRLATDWKRIDNKTVRFNLRKGVKFHSGNIFTAKDVVFTVNRLKSSSNFKAIFEPISEVKIIDDYTIELITKDVYPLLLNTVTYIFPLDSKFYAGKDKINNLGTSFASKNSSGTGPFIVTERQQGVKVVYEKFDGYWDKNRGNIDKIILTPISENGTRTAALLSGDVNFISPVAPTDFKLIEKDPRTKLITMAGTRIISFHMNQKRNKALADVRVRKAIVYAINNEGIVKKIMNNFATVAGQQSPKGFAGYDKKLKPRYDLKKAKKLMKEAGYKDGFSLTMIAPNNRYVNDAKIAQAVASMLAKIKIKVDLKTMPKAQYWPAFDKRAADMMLIGWHADTEDSANFHKFLTMCENEKTGAGVYNANSYCNPKLDALVTSANKETDIKKRNALLRKASNIIYNDAVIVPLHWQNLTWATAKGIKAEPILNVMNFPYFGDLIID